MSPMPVLNPIAQSIYDEIAPIAYGDATNNYALAQFVEAWTRPMLVLQAIVHDTDTGPGWSTVMDPVTAPDLFLDWLSQFVGVRRVAGETTASKRARIEAMDGIRRGGPASMKAAIQRTLTGTKTVLFNERQGSAWKLGIATFTTETPNSADTLAAILKQKPAGITLTYVTASGVTYALLVVVYDTYQDVKNTFLTYNGVKNNLPGT